MLQEQSADRQEWARGVAVNVAGEQDVSIAPSVLAFATDRENAQELKITMVARSNIQ